MFPVETHLDGRVARLLFVIFLAVMLLVTFNSLSPVAGATPPAGSGIVTSVVKAPIVPDGNVSGALTDLVITLDGSLDPAVEGRTLLKGMQIKVTLPDDFENTGLPGGTNLTPECGPFPFKCSTGILLQGWPQHPIFPMFPPGIGPPQLYTVSLEGTHTLVFTALEDIKPGAALPGPGIKQMHMFALGFINPAPGFYDIEVMAQTGPGGSWESGTGRVHIVPHIRRSINVASVYNGQGNPNTIYQETGTNAETTLPFDFLLWDEGGAPLLNVDIQMVNSEHALLRQGRKVVGHVHIKAPKGEEGQEVSAESPSYLVQAPNSGIDTGRLTTFFKTGSKAGLYEVTFSLNGGDEVTMFVTAK